MSTTTINPFATSDCPELDLGSSIFGAGSDLDDLESFEAELDAMEHRLAEIAEEVAFFCDDHQLDQNVSQECSLAESGISDMCWALRSVIEAAREQSGEYDED
jgi:hypothetical protein